MALHFLDRLTLTAPLFRRWAAVIGAVAIAAILFAAVALMPDAMLARSMWASGLAGLLPPEAMPPGPLLRAEIALGVAVVAGAVGWAVFYLLLDPPAAKAGPARRAAPASPRRVAGPAPRADDPAQERPLPVDLDVPLAAFDPAALPETPLAPQPLVASLAARTRREDRRSGSVDTLLVLLEQGAARRRARSGFA